MGNGAGPCCYPSQCSLKELGVRQDEVYLSINRKNKASVTSLCSAEAIGVLFCRSSIDEVQAAAQCGFWDKEQVDLASSEPDCFQLLSRIIF